MDYIYFAYKGADFFKVNLEATSVTYQKNLIFVKFTTCF